MNIAPFSHRRARLMDDIDRRGGGVAVLFTAPERTRSRDTEYPYRFDSHFWYLTGFPEPGAAIVLRVRDGERRAILFCRSRDAEREIWDGFRFGPERAQAEFQFDEARPIDEIDVTMPDLLADAPALYCALAADGDLDARIKRWLTVVRSRARSGVRAPATVADLVGIVDEMRLVKDASELDCMRRAAEVSASAHRRAMRATRSGLREYEVEAELLYEFRRRGAQAPAYGSIVAAGANACVLHYAAGDAELVDGALCLIDAGCEVDGYASDLTRTFPVSGRFTGPQRAVYEIVLDAQQAAIDRVRAGENFNAPHDAATRVLTQGLIDLGLLAGSVDGVIESGAYRQFYMHRTGHWLGLDVHDVDDYRDPDGCNGDTVRGWRNLAPGMALTVEPGLYFRPAANVPDQFVNIGVRIEDDVVVGDGDCEVLTRSAPKSIDDIEALMRS